MRKGKGTKKKQSIHEKGLRKIHKNSYEVQTKHKRMCKNEAWVCYKKLWSYEPFYKRFI